MLFRSQAFVLQLKGINFIFLLNLLNFGFKVSFFLLLEILLVLESLVLSLYVALNLRNVLFSFSLCVLLKVFKELSILLGDSLFLSFEIFFALFFNMQKLGQQSLVASVLILKLFFLDHPGILKLQQHLLSGHQTVHSLGLVVELSVLFAHDFLLFELGFIFVLFQLELLPLIQLLQLVLVLGDGLGLLINLPLEDSSDLEHVLFVQRNVLGGLADVLLEVKEAESSLLYQIIEVGDVVCLSLLLLLNVLFCH